MDVFDSSSRQRSVSHVDRAIRKGIDMPTIDMIILDPGFSSDSNNSSPIIESYNELIAAKTRERSRTSSGRKTGEGSFESVSSLHLGALDTDLEKFEKMEHSETFAYFRRYDSTPRLQRKLLFAINLRHLSNNKQKEGATKCTQEAHVKAEKSKKLGFGIKLNALLRSKKQKKTRAGIFHSLQLSIHDLRIQDSLSFIELLSESTLLKKKPSDSNKAFLHALANGMQSVCVAMLEKGFPSNVNLPIFACSTNTANGDGFTFPSYFQLAVALDLLETAKAMIKAKAMVEIGWYQVTPLLNACQKGNEKMIRLLIENGANISQRIGFEDFLLLSLLKRSKNGVRDALECKIDLELESVLIRQAGSRGHITFGTEYVDGKTLCLFELAASSGHLEIASYLLSQ